MKFAHLFSLHAVEVCQSIADGVDPYVSHVQTPRGVGKHGQHVVLATSQTLSSSSSSFFAISRSCQLEAVVNLF